MVTSIKSWYLNWKRNSCNYQIRDCHTKVSIKQLRLRTRPDETHTNLLYTCWDLPTEKARKKSVARQACLRIQKATKWHVSLFPRGGKTIRPIRCQVSRFLTREPWQGDFHSAGSITLFLRNLKLSRVFKLKKWIFPQSSLYQKSHSFDLGYVNN